MDNLLDRVENELNGLVDCISRYKPIEPQSKKFLELDQEVLEVLSTLRKHYDACKRLEALRLNLGRLENQIDSTLIGLSDCRKQLENTGSPSDNDTGVEIEELLNYATKITKFMHLQPGSENILPWPTEDQIRRGMLATVAVQNGAQIMQPQEMEDVQEDKHQHDHGPAGHDAAAAAADGHARAPQERKPTPKINLDLFDSDED